PPLHLNASRPLTPDDNHPLPRPIHYYCWSLNHWQPLQPQPLAAALDNLSFPAAAQHPPGEAVTYLAQTRPLNATPWNLPLLSP
ncbi:sensor histidine kinase, partial [Pseudomonas aeruginosa]